VGEKLSICGVTRKARLLLSVPLGIATVTLPVVVLAATVVMISDLSPGGEQTNWGKTDVVGRSISGNRSDCSPSERRKLRAY
jgi:hypothetical protein